MTLAQYIQENMNRKFVWGQFDCVLFAARWVQIDTGKDYLGIVEPWFSALGAARVLEKMGGMEAAVDKFLGRLPNANFAIDGDVAFHNGTLWLYSGTHIVGPGLEGLVFVDRMVTKCAWRCS